jgi:hypothetical protein
MLVYVSPAAAGPTGAVLFSRLVLLGCIPHLSMFELQRAPAWLGHNSPFLLSSFLNMLWALSSVWM